VLALASLLLPAIAGAAKPGGGGPAPTGKIYYYQNPGGPSHPVYSMNPDGSGKSLLQVSIGVPGGMLHGGKRWFLRTEEAPTGPGGALHWELFAEREDGALKVRLTDDPAMDFIVTGTNNWHWAPDETASAVTIGGIGRRWYADGSLEPGSAGLYTATLRFDQTGNVIGLDYPPAFLVSVGTRPPSCCDEFPDAHFFSWSPDMTQVVVDRWTADDLRIIDVATAASTTLLDDAVETYGRPRWSAAGTRIVFERANGQVFGEAIESIAPDGTNRQVLATSSRSGGGARVSRPSWSPDSAFVIYRNEKVLSTTPPTYEQDIWRMTATGSGKVNLTSDTSVDSWSLGWR
jgi:hypothetical protein